MYNYTYYIETEDGYEIEVNLDYNISGEAGTELTTYNEKIVAIRDENGNKILTSFGSEFEKQLLEYLQDKDFINKLEIELWEDYDNHLDGIAN